LLLRISKTEIVFPLTVDNQLQFNQATRKSQGGTMKKQALVITATIFTFIIISAPAFAGKSDNQKYNGNQACPRYMQDLRQNWADLTQEQQTQLKTLHQKFVDETATQRISMISKQEQIRTLMETSTPDRDQLIALTGEIEDLKKAIMIKRIDFALEAKKIAPELRLPMFFGSMGKFHGQGGFHGHKKRN